MSNPAVMNLVAKNISGHNVWLDDNFGEAVHIHIDKFRIDLTNTDFNSLCEDLCDVINKLVDIPGFDCHKIDPVCLELDLLRDLLKIERVNIETMNLRDMLCGAGWGKITRLPNSFGVKVVNDEAKSTIPHNYTLHITQTDQQRFDSAFNNILEHDYPYDGRYILMHTNNRILDGHHRACALWKLKGDVAIPVMRVYFDDSVILPPVKSPTILESLYHRAINLIMKPVKFFCYLFFKPRKLFMKAYNFLCSARTKYNNLKVSTRRKVYTHRYSAQVLEINDIFDGK